MAELQQQSPLSSLDRAGTAISVLGATAALLLIVAAGAALALVAPWLPVALAAAVLVCVWCIQRPVRWVYLLIAVMFLEAETLSLHLGGARVRMVQILLIPTLATVAFYAIGDRLRWRGLPLVVPIVLYLAGNYLATFFGVSLSQGAKISLLLTGLALLYFAVYVIVRNDPAAWPAVLRAFVVIGLIEILIGLYQVAAGYANARLGWSLPIGLHGIMHTGYLGVFFGRPYGTLPEPDTYGAVCLFYALFAGLLWLTPSRAPAPRWLLLLTATAALLGLLIGFVRASWFGFLFGLGWAFGLFLFQRLRSFRTFQLGVALWCALILCTAAVVFSPDIRDLLERRFTARDETALGLQNARFQQMKVSFRHFLQRPILGNGPGSFSLIGVFGADEEYWRDRGVDPRVLYDPSILTTVLNDTGLLGAATMLLLIVSYFRVIRSSMRRMNDQGDRNAAIAGHCALIGLFASFIFTQYFWMPFFWMFAAIVLLLAQSPFLPRDANAPSRSAAAGNESIP